jgi:hypothetical protein
MTLQRFQNFQFGALDAGRLNQLVDAVMRMEQRVEQMARPYEPTKDVILAQIIGAGTKAGYDLCQGAMRCVSYPFQEVGLGIQRAGPIDAGTCVQPYQIEGGLSSTQGAFLLLIEKEPSLAIGDVVKAHLASRADVGTAEDKGMVYIGTPVAPANAGNVELATVVAGGNGLYDCTLDESGEPIQAYNLYETNDYYGALDATVECAVLSVSQTIPAGSTIWVFRPIVNGAPSATWVTMTPVPFDSACTCNPGTIQQQVLAAADSAGAADGRDGIAAHIISRVMGI